MTGAVLTPSAMSGAIARGERIPLYKRLYIWSVIFEPLFLFVLFESSSVGITGNVSRLLQALFCVVLIARFGARLLGPRPTIPLPVPTRQVYRYYSATFLLAVIAGIIGAARGAYAIPDSYVALGATSQFASLLNSAAIRPIFEYITAAYYFIYFVVFAQFLLTSRAEVEYFFRAFKRMFVLSYVVGAIDWLVSWGGVGIIPRHISDWSVVGEGRFHGLAGEPRQAFVYLFLGLAMLHLMAFWEGRALDRRWFWAVVAAAIATKSATGLVAVAIFVGIYGIYAIRRLRTFTRILQLTAGLAVVSAIAYVAAVKTPRVLAYVQAASGLWYILEHNMDLPYLMSKANSDIYPTYDLTVKARAGDWLPIIIGSGFGSASAVSNRYYRQVSTLNNPHSQLVRSLYETGIVGTILYVMAFLAPVALATKRLPEGTRREFLLFTALLVGCSLADRSSAPFIYLGVFWAVFRILIRDGRLTSRVQPRAH